MGVALVNDDARRCALPGCEELIEDVPGPRPPRVYCSVAHRRAVRRARRAAALRPNQDAGLAETLPWLREPVDEEPAGWAPVRSVEPLESVHASSVPAGASRSRGGIAARMLAGMARGARPDELPALRRRRRAVAVLGVAGILAGGYAVTASEPVSGRAAPPAQPVPGPEAEGEAEDEWAARAQVTLTSVDRQLDTIAHTEEAWSRLPQERQAAVPPAPVQALKDRKALLERRRATLQSQIDTYQSLDRTRDDLKLTEQHLHAVEKVLRNAPTQPQLPPDQASVIAALDEQRDLRLRQRAAKRAELENLEKGVRSAVRTPLPDDGQETVAVSDHVLDVIRTDRSGGEHGSAPRRPEVLPREERHQQRERQDTATGGPPDPRGPGDETAQRRGGLVAGGDRGRPERGHVVQLDHVVGGVPTGGGARRDESPAAGGSGRSRAGGGSGVVGQVVSAVGVVGGGGSRDGEGAGRDPGNGGGGRDRAGGPRGGERSSGGRPRDADGGSGVVGEVAGAVGRVAGGGDSGGRGSESGGRSGGSRDAGDQDGGGDRSGGDRSGGDRSGGDRASREQSRENRNGGHRSGRDRSTGDRDSGNRSSGERNAGEASGGSRTRVGSSTSRSSADDGGGDDSNGEPSSASKVRLARAVVDVIGGQGAVREIASALREAADSSREHRSDRSEGAGRSGSGSRDGDRSAASGQDTQRTKSSPQSKSQRVKAQESRSEESRSDGKSSSGRSGQRSSGQRSSDEGSGERDSGEERSEQRSSGRSSDDRSGGQRPGEQRSERSERSDQKSSERRQRASNGDSEGSSRRSNGDDSGTSRKTSSKGGSSSSKDSSGSSSGTGSRSKSSESDD
jgi:hypothetical protein